MLKLRHNEYELNHEMTGEIFDEHESLRTGNEATHISRNGLLHMTASLGQTLVTEIEDRYLQAWSWPGRQPNTHTLTIHILLQLRSVQRIHSHSTDFLGGQTIPVNWVNPARPVVRRCPTHVIHPAPQSTVASQIDTSTEPGLRGRRRDEVTDWSLRSGSSTYIRVYRRCELVSLIDTSSFVASPRTFACQDLFEVYTWDLTISIPPHQHASMGKKRVLVGYGVDIDAVAGWLGSYKGEDSTSDISRGTSLLMSSPHPTHTVFGTNPLTRVHLSSRPPRRPPRHPPHPQTLLQIRHQSHLVHTRSLPRDLPRRICHDP